MKICVCIDTKNGRYVGGCLKIYNFLTNFFNNLFFFSLNYYIGFVFYLTSFYLLFIIFKLYYYYYYYYLLLLLLYILIMSIFKLPSRLLIFLSYPQGNFHRHLYKGGGI